MKFVNISETKLSKLFKILMLSKFLAFSIAISLSDDVIVFSHLEDLQSVELLNYLYQNYFFFKEIFKSIFKWN